MKILKGLAEGQVLQRIGRRGATASLAGPCAETGPVLATVASAQGILKGWNDRRVGRASRGEFSAQLAGIPAGGPYRLSLRCHQERTRVKAFFAGDVWLLAGQSNMEGMGDMTAPAKPHPLVRAFSLRREWRQAADPLHVLGESPDPCHHGGRPLTPAQAGRHRRTTPKGVGVGVFFAREMLARSGVPQGLIAAAHGGTSMAEWDPSLKARGGASLYGSMLLSLRAAGQPVAGVLWYQGESDTDGRTAEVYTKKMRALVAAVRRDLRQPSLPWITVQLGAVHGQAERPDWNRIQEQQRLLPAKIARLETVPAIDLPLDDRIHIAAEGFPLLAQRCARAADRLAYGNRCEAPMPRLLKIVPPPATVATGHIDVVFAHVRCGLRSAGSPRGFTLLDGGGRELPAIFKTTLRGDTVRLHFQVETRLPSDTRLAYGFGRAPVCTLTDIRDCALPVFGPRPLFKSNPFLPFMTAWRVCPVAVSPVAPLRDLPCPDPQAPDAETRVYPAEGFVNEHPRWQRQSGHGYFSARLTLPESMRLKFLLGYDGPFRLWLDGTPFYTDLAGTNPCVPDEFSKVAHLPAGTHTLTVAMDLNEGAAWGFFLRFRRCDLPAAQLRKGAYARPVYSV